MNDSPPGDPCVCGHGYGAHYVEQDFLLDRATQKPTELPAGPKRVTCSGGIDCNCDGYVRRVWHPVGVQSESTPGVQVDAHRAFDDLPSITIPLPDAPVARCLVLNYSLASGMLECRLVLSEDCTRKMVDALQRSLDVDLMRLADSIGGLW